MRTLQPSDATTPNPPRFRGSTFEEAMAVAAAELGPDVEVVEASRIRRGGLGGFFATDLGVEIAVRPASDAAPAAGTGADAAGAPATGIERLLAKAEATERAIAEPNNFAAVLAGELGASRPVPAAVGPTTAEWSAEAYRQLAIPAAAPREQAAPAPQAVDVEPAPAADPEPPAKPAARKRPAAKPAGTRPAATTPVGGSTPAGSSQAASKRTAATRSAATPRAAAPSSTGGVAAPTFVGATQAAAELLTQLSAQAPAPGSLAGRITTLTVKLTTPEGVVVEVSAAVGAAS